MLLSSKLIFRLLCKYRLCQRNVRSVCGLYTLFPHLNFKIVYCNTSRNSYTTMANKNNTIFEGKTDRFNGVAVDSSKENCGSIDEFADKLKETLEIWEQNGKRGIWFKVHHAQADWVPVLAKQGFKFHHAKDEYVMMYLWLPKNEICNIPQYAHTMMGVGAVVVNDKSQVLVVREKYSVIDRPFWKLPGGYVEPGENLVDAAIREVREETNILTEFQSVLTVRQTHNGMFGCSDIYTVISLKPLSEIIQKCEREIAQCEWMAIDEYLNHPQVHDLNRFFVQKYLEYKKHDIKINCFHGIHQVIHKPYTVYSVTRAEEEKDNMKNGPNDS
ncbi:hypothetical protein JTB14_004003 [Gonioctena quinquepunctata]|nr:hypothetical protein JTB14_004003 [Gonioctena quinquepunctata]